ncbi:MAG: tRNA preQ1(34) S-adenosylmethionine ribosyltransferase-isomerase QueA [Gammaproteobacteria bacterium]
MQTSDFDYELPAELIAQHPLAERSASRLLALDESGGVTDRHMRDLPSLLAPGDLLVFNDTRVIPARLFAVKSTGGQVELLVERLLDERRALVHARASKPIRAGARLAVQGGGDLVAGEREGELLRVESSHEPLLELLARAGHVPLPPYIRRGDEPADRERYQSVFARVPGAVAAPTASLHFDEALLAALTAGGVGTACITLHVGAGTFQPVRGEDPAAHRLHREWCEIGAEATAAIDAARERGGRIVAVGTTVVRTLESAAEAGGVAVWQGETGLFILPGFRFRVVDVLVTNFHLPRSTLLMLVSAAAGRERVLAAYRHAVAAGYRFYSYGDAMFLPVREEAKA